MRTALRLGTICIVTTALFTAKARGDVTSDIYQDMRDVVEEVIRDDVSQGIARRVTACYPVVGDYFHDSIEKLDKGTWSTIARTLRSDLIGMTTDYVFYTFNGCSGEEANPKADPKTCLAKFFGRIPVDTATCTATDPPVLNQPPKPSIVAQRCRSDVDIQPGTQESIACHVALATESALLNDQAGIREYLLDFGADIVVAGGRRIWQQSLGHNPTNTEVTTWRGSAGKLRDVARDRLSRWLASGKDFQEDLQALQLFVSTDGFANIQCEASQAAPACEWLKNLIVVERESKGALDRGRGHDAAHGDSSPPASSARPLPPRPARPAPAKVVDLETGELTQTPEAPAVVGEPAAERHEAPLRRGPLQQLQSPSAAFKQAQLKTFTEETLAPLFVRSAATNPKVELARVFLEMEHLVSAVRSRWAIPNGSNAGTSEIRLAEFLSTALSTATMLCKESQQPLGERSCDWLLKYQAELKVTYGLVSAAEKHEYGLVVGRLLEPALAKVRGKQGKQQTDLQVSIQRFFVSLVSYVADSDSSANARDVSREAFRKAGRDVITNLKGKGIPPAAHQKVSLYPELGVAVQWNRNYLNETSRAGLRYTLTAKWPTWRWAATENFGLTASALDFMAPLSEVVFRKASLIYKDQRYLLLDLLRPRVGLWFGLPAISRNVVVDAGAAMRFVRIDTSDPVLTYYRGSWHGQGQANTARTEPFFDWVELSFGISYVF